MKGWVGVLLGGLLLCAIATAGIALNFALLRLTGEANDPVGKLSPRSVAFEQTTVTTPNQTDPVVTDDTGHGSEANEVDDDDDD